MTSKVCEVPTHFLQVSERMMLCIHYEESHRHPLGCHYLGLRLVEFIHSEPLLRSCPPGSYTALGAQRAPWRHFWAACPALRSAEPDVKVAEAEAI